VTRTLLVLALLAALAAPAFATASTVHVRSIPGSGKDMGPPSSRLFFTAAAGERNVLTIAPETTSVWLVRDAGAALTAGAGCAAVDANTARCTHLHPLITNPGAVIDTADGDDRVTIEPPITVDVDAGDGADSVTGSGSIDGGKGDDTLAGGPDRDVLTGGPGRDVLRGGPHDDTLVGDGGTGNDSGAEDDLIDGGDGRDRIDYSGRRARVVIDLADGLPDGEHGEHDRLHAVEDVTTGSGDDIVLGNAAANMLDGAKGDDRLDGRAGPDLLWDAHGDGADLHRGGPGDDQLFAYTAGDRLFGAGGNDKLAVYARGVRADAGPGSDEIGLTVPPASMTCGSGIDALSFSGFGTRRPLARVTVDSCETLIAAVTSVLRPQRGPGARLRVPVQCRTVNAPLGCRGDVRIRLIRRGRAPIALGAGSYALAAGAQTTVSIAVAAGRRRRALAGDRTPLVEVTLTYGLTGDRFAPPNAPPTFTGRWRVHLGPPA